MSVLSRLSLRPYYFHLVYVAVTARTKVVIECPHVCRLSILMSLARLLVVKIMRERGKLYTFFAVRLQNTCLYVEESKYNYVEGTT
jgi:hypothetical protein